MDYRRSYNENKIFTRNGCRIMGLAKQPNKVRGNIIQCINFQMMNANE